MPDIEERLVVSGRVFELTLREHTEPHVHWIAWVKVVGKDHQGSSESFTGLSEGHVRDLAHRWMLKYKS